MLVLEDKTKRIIQVYKTFKRILKRYGRNISFPKDTDPSKTYSWRFLSKFIDDYDKLGLDDSMMNPIIEQLIREADHRKMLRCGISILSKFDLLQLAHDKLKYELQQQKHIIDEIIKSHQFVSTQLDQKRTKDPCLTIEQMLSYQPNRRSYANITRWFESGYLALGYIAISRSCKRAISKLDEQQQQIFPDPLQFMAVRLRLLSDQQHVGRMRQLLGKDLFEE